MVGQTDGEYRASQRAANAPPDDPGFEPLDAPQTQFADWTPGNSQAHEENVEVYSNCEEVELFLNGKSLGAKDKPRDDSPRVWKVKFEPGTIKAVAKNGDSVVAGDELRTAGKPAKIVLTTDREKLSPRLGRRCVRPGDGR